MKLHFKEEKQTLTLPAECLDVLTDADAADLRVLLHIAACEADGAAFDTAAAAEALQLSESEVRSSVKFWRGAGVLKADNAKSSGVKKDAEAKAAAKKPLRAKHSSSLGSEELCKIAETDSTFTALLDIAQQMAGWMFNTAEIEIVARLHAELKLSDEYILAMIGYFICKREKPLRYMEKVAYQYVEKGIPAADALEEKLRMLERFEGLAGKIRQMFGIGGRDLTEKEEKYLTDWFDNYKFDDDVIRLAYEKTVNNTGKASVHYANTILRSWYAEGLRTARDIREQSGRAPTKPVAGSGKKSSIATQSFDVNDAFQKALERSYSEEKK